MTPVTRGILHALAIEAVIIVALFAAVTRGHAQVAAVYTAADVVAAIDQASDEMGVSRKWLYRAVRCETGGTFNPYSIGRQGELGPAQLHPRGELPRFISWGYTDPFDPYQSIRFMAQRFSMGGASAWSCA